MELQRLIARNLHDAMEKKLYGEVNQSMLARMTGVSQKTISNILSANEKPDEEVDTLPSTSIAILGKLAEKLGIPTWALLHPDPERAAKIDDVYKTFDTGPQQSAAQSGKRDKLGGTIIGHIENPAEKFKKHS